MFEAFTFDMERQGLSVQTLPIESNLKNINFHQEQTESWDMPQSGSCIDKNAAHMARRGLEDDGKGFGKAAGGNPKLCLNYEISMRLLKSKKKESFLSMNRNGYKFALPAALMMFIVRIRKLQSDEGIPYAKNYAFFMVR